MSGFSKAVEDLQLGADISVIENVHAALLNKFYNVRSNEFLRSIGKMDCIKDNKAVDANIGLRDKLKSYAVKKQSEV